MNKSKGLGSYRRVTITLTPKEESILDDIVSKITELGGHRMSRTEIIRAALNYIASLDIDLSGIKDQDELQQRIIEAVK